MQEKQTEAIISKQRQAAASSSEQHAHPSSKSDLLAF